VSAPRHSVAIAVFTRDLRVRDNPVLTAATQSAERVVPLFVFDDEILATSHARPNRFGFLIESLADLDRSLRERGGGLVVRRGDWLTEIARIVVATQPSAVHIGYDVSGFAQRRLARLEAECPCPVVAHDTVTVVAHETLKPYMMFTPYWRAWQRAPQRAVASPVRRIALPDELAVGLLPPMPTGRAPAVPPGGETAGLHRLKQWAARGLAEYADQRDEVGLDATSRISPYLHFGCLSPLEVATRLYGRDGGEEFVRQLCWRDFFHQFLAAHPETAHRDVRDRAPRWSDDSDALTAWRDGRTGFPLVDAGMRQLLREGWMHNRARMVVASFLTKDLMIDWRAGAAHFMEHLVDGDIAVNQLNWQWVAGTGTDTNPHRVYNPTVQSRKFDRAGSYIRRYVAELTELDGDIHDPAPEDRAASGYPDPIIDHKLAIERWRAARSGA
jgi:deoxyribodipyrimidine photo-lyase